MAVTAIFDILKGDVNLDGVVGVADATIMVRYAAGGVALSDFQKQVGNVAGHEDDNDIGVADAIMILVFLVSTPERELSKPQGPTNIKDH
jgi:hypothetical protein